MPESSTAEIVRCRIAAELLACGSQMRTIEVLVLYLRKKERSFKRWTIDPNTATVLSVYIENTQYTSATTYLVSFVTFGIQCAVVHGKRTG